MHNYYFARCQMLIARFGARAVLVIPRQFANSFLPFADRKHEPCGVGSGEWVGQKYVEIPATEALEALRKFRE